MKHAFKILLSIFICVAILMVLPTIANGQEFSSDNTFSFSANRLNKKELKLDIASKTSYNSLPVSVPVSVPVPVSVSPSAVRISFTANDFLNNESIAKQHLYEISASSFGSAKMSTARKEKQRWFNVCIINNSVTTIAGKIYRHLFK